MFVKGVPVCRWQHLVDRGLHRRAIRKRCNRFSEDCIWANIWADEGGLIPVREWNVYHNRRWQQGRPGTTWLWHSDTGPLWWEPTGNFLHHLSVVLRIRRSLLDFPHIGTILRALIFSLSLNKESVSRWFEMLWLSCEVILMCIVALFKLPN